MKSETKKGATFFFTIPYNPVFDKKTGFENSNHTILIVEDEEVNYLYLETCLDMYEQNLEIIHAKNGKLAIEILNQNPNIDLIFMDLKMPIMNGYMATKLIKQTHPNLPIIAQTAYSSSGDKNNAFKAGCDDFISKPIKNEDIMKLLEKYLNIIE